MPLTDTQARKALPGEKDYKLADSGGLYLFVTTKAFKSWRLKYRFGGKEKRLVLGSYPDVSLKEARDRRDRARAELRDHKDPAIEEKKREMAAHAAAGATFKVVAGRWYEAQCPRWSPVQRKKVAQPSLRRSRCVGRMLQEAFNLGSCEIDLGIEHICSRHNASAHSRAH